MRVQRVHRTKRGQIAQALGYSRGGVLDKTAPPEPVRFSTKIHVSVDALGNPLRLLLTPGQAHEVPYVQTLLKDYETEFVFGDKAYDAEHVLATIAEVEAEVVIPPKKNRKKQRNYDKEHYKERHLVECFFNKLKHFRRCFSRFDKFARNYLSFLHFASALIWLR